MEETFVFQITPMDLYAFVWPALFLCSCPSARPTGGDGAVYRRDEVPLMEETFVFQITPMDLYIDVSAYGSFI